MPSVKVVGATYLVSFSLGGGEVSLFEGTMPIPRGLEPMQGLGKGWIQPIFLGEQRFIIRNIILSP